MRESGKFLLVEFEEFLALESGLRLKESGIPLTTGIQNPSSTDIKLEASSWNPESLAWSSKSKTVLYSLIWGENGPGNNKRLGAMTRSEQSGIEYNLCPGVAPVSSLSSTQDG